MGEESELSKVSERWCFTIPREEGDRETITNLAMLQMNQNIKFLAVGAGGYMHWQGALIFQHGKARSGAGVKKLLSEKAHIEAMKMDTKSALKYCTKEGSLCFQKDLDILFGDRKTTTGERERAKTDKRKEQKDQVAREITKDLGEMEPEEFAEKWPGEWLRNRKRCEEFITEAMGKRATVWPGNLQAKNFWIWGKPGVGKSKWATQQGPIWRTYRKNVNKWWDGYSICSHNTVLIEDYPCFPQGDCLQHHMKVWADRYPFTGEKKCSHLQVEPGRFILIVTSNYPIEKCFSHQENVEAIKRRFNEIEMTSGNAVLIRSLSADYGILTTKNPEGGMLAQDMNEEEEGDLERALQEERLMQAESQELGELEDQEEEEERRPKKGIRYPEEW
jgi:hypothetical protein